MPKEHALLLSVFLLCKFLFKDLIIAAFTAYFICGIVALCATLPPPMKRFVTKECNYEDVVSRTPLIHTVSVDFIKSRVVASIPGFFFCIWYAAKKYSLAINDLGISYYIQGIEMLSLRLLKMGAILLNGLLMHDIFWVVFTSVMVRLVFPTADAAWPSSMFTIGDTVIPGIFVAIALHIAVPRCSKNHFFNCAFFRYTVGLTVIIIIMNWFQATQPSLLYAAHGVIGFVAVHFLFNGEVNQIRLKDGINQLMAKVWDWNMYGTELKRFDRWVFHTANENCDRVDNATALLDDRGDDPKDGSSGPESLEDSDDEIMPLGQRAVQLLVIRANFPICAINGYDGQKGQPIYFLRQGEVQEEGMVDLVPVGPCDVFMAYGVFILEVFYFTTTASDEEGSSSIGPLIKKGWDVCEEETKEYTQTICASPGRELEITYLVIPCAIETKVEIRLKLKDLGSRSHAIYGKIKASATDYGNKSIHLFSREQRRSLSFPSGSISILPLCPYVIALPHCRHLEFRIEVDLTIITTSESQEEDKN